MTLEARRQLVAAVEALGFVRVEQSQLRSVLVYQHPTKKDKKVFIGLMGGARMGPNYGASQALSAEARRVLLDATRQTGGR